jgi:hypothetical protein
VKNWLIGFVLAFGLQSSLHAAEENFRTFRTVDPAQLEKKVPMGYGRFFVQAGRQYNIDPVFLAAISAHEQHWYAVSCGRCGINTVIQNGPTLFRMSSDSRYSKCHCWVILAISLSGFNAA